MKRLKIAGLAFAIVLALSAIAAASASASGELELVNHEGKELVKKSYTGEGGETTFETVAGRKLTCTKVVISGKVKGTKEGEGTSIFTGCKSEGISCNTSGSASGEVSMGYSYGWVWLYTTFDIDQAYVYTWLPFGVTTVSVQCSSLETLTLKDGMVGPVSEVELGKLTKELTLKANETKGEQESTKYKIKRTEEGSKEAIIMTKGEGLVKFEYEKAAVENAGIKLKFEEEVKLVEN